LHSVFSLGENHMPPISAEKHNELRREAKRRQQAAARAKAVHGRKGTQEKYTPIQMAKIERKQRMQELKALYKKGGDVNAMINSWLDMVDKKPTGVVIRFPEDSYQREVFEQAKFELNEWIRNIDANLIRVPDHVNYSTHDVTDISFDFMLASVPLPK
jgi:hypothetical protein